MNLTHSWLVAARGIMLKDGFSVKLLMNMSCTSSKTRCPHQVLSHNEKPHQKFKIPSPIQALDLHLIVKPQPTLIQERDLCLTTNSNSNPRLSDSSKD
jgi:hypothetical protein